MAVNIKQNDLFDDELKITLVLKNSPIVLKYAKQGMPGRTGPMGLPGQDAIAWSVSVTMEGIPNGRCTIKLYKDGKLANNEIHYAAVHVMPTHESSYVLSNEYSRTISGTYTFQYEEVRAIFVIIYEDSFAEKVLTAGTATMIRGRGIKILNCAPLSFTSAEWQAKGTAGTSNVWTTGSTYDNSTIEDGDTVIISGTISDQLDQTDTAISGFILGKAVIPEGGNASQSVRVISQAFVIGPAGAAATIQIGTVTTLPYDAQATVVNSGTPNNAIFDIGIPRGTPGEAVNTLPFDKITGSPTDNTALSNALNGKVAKSGDTMTGALKFSKENVSAIGYQGTQAYYPMIKFKDNTSDVYGNGIFIGGGGLTIIGGGESADAAAGAFTTGGDERLILCNDGGIDIWTNCQNGEASATKRTIDNNGNFSGNAANVTGTVAIAHGGTGATTAANACTNLGAVKKSGDTVNGMLNIMGGMAMRATNPNRAATGTGGIYQFKATASMTANKPPLGDGHILGFEWDNTGGWDAQLYIRNNGFGQLMTRSMNGGTWGAWTPVCYYAGISTSDLTAGTSALTDNQLYFVYA